MTGPSSRYQASGWQVGRLACLPLLPGLTAAVPGAQESQFLEPPVPLGPLTPPQWDEDQQLGGLKESLSHQCDLLLDKRGHPRLPAEAADLGPMGKADTDLSLLLWTQLPLPLEVRVDSSPLQHEFISCLVTPLTLVCPLQATGPLTPVPSQLCPWRRKLGRVSACTCVVSALGMHVGSMSTFVGAVSTCMFVGTCDCMRGARVFHALPWVCCLL